VKESSWRENGRGETSQEGLSLFGVSFSET
jgi:hypothetical protein